MSYGRLYTVKGGLRVLNRYCRVGFLVLEVRFGYGLQRVDGVVCCVEPLEIHVLEAKSHRDSSFDKLPHQLYCSSLGADYGWAVIPKHLALSIIPDVFGIITVDGFGYARIVREPIHLSEIDYRKHIPFPTNTIFPTYIAKETWEIAAKILGGIGVETVVPKNPRSRNYAKAVTALELYRRTCKTRKFGKSNVAVVQGEIVCTKRKSGRYYPKGKVEEELSRKIRETLKIE